MANTYHFSKKTIKDIDVSGKRILLRADFNVPLGDDGKINSDFRLRATLPTIKYLLKHKAEVVIISHLGRPEAKPEPKYSFKPVAQALSKLIDQPVEFVGDCIGDEVFQALKFIHPGKITLLENTRFHKGEKANDSGFAQAIKKAVRPDYFVQDGFGNVHRKDASMAEITNLVPAVSGLLVEAEVTQLSKAISSPNKPLVAVIGGAKISDKLPLIEHFLDRADTILVGGALANTFLKQAGVTIGKSLYEPNQESEVKRILKKAKPDQVILPIDVGVATEVSVHSMRRNTKIQYVHASEYILDIGPVTAELFNHYVEAAGTVIWNGTLGYAENPRFSKGSAALSQALANHYPSLTSIIGGGDTAEFVLGWQEHNKNKKFTHVSTGGGASLELLSGKKLPGVEALLSA